ncbi:TetR/AcrR family transcriptional regulator [Mycolicibacterium stellerae]|uniref:TetR/AcrR family transcriptional regulator n=1 Tax=Mycolicibacterium stellerae TaxID=2358193 RepID=UPI000F0B7FD5|nr:TetR/AcrR family transcriptional regulator [Mycolicibacterium stellerae]
MAGMAQVRPYRGIEAAERLDERRRRLVEAGLDLLGGDSAETDLTVRAVCSRAGLTARYFYESFTDKDEFVVAVFDAAVADVAATTQAAVAASPPAGQGRAGIANLVRIVSTDSRMGRVLFDVRMSNPVILRKRSDLGGIFAFLLAQHLASALRRDQTGRSNAAVHFVVGGVGQTISAWLAGEVDLSQEQLVDQLAAILGALDDPGLYFD